MINDVVQLTYSEAAAGGELVWLLEQRDSRRVGTEQASLVFVLQGTADESEARRIAENGIMFVAPAFDGKALEHVELVPEFIDPDNVGDPDLGTGRGLWQVTASYSRRAFQPPALVAAANQAAVQAMEIDIGGENRRLFQSYRTLQEVAAPGFTAEHYGGAINVIGEGKDLRCEGVDVPVLRKRISLARTYPIAQVGAAFLYGLEDLYGRVNNAPFTVNLNGEEFTWPAGCLRYMGTRGRLVQGAGHVDLIHQFEAGWSRTVTLGEGSDSQINLGAVRPFETIWVRYGTKAGNNRYLKVPIQANVEQTALEGDFSILNVTAP
jgi:hypothetical protein